MNMTVILIKMAAFAAQFTAVILLSYRGDGKYSTGAIHNYPPDIQEEYFKTHEQAEVSFRSKKILLAKGFSLLFFTVVLLGSALLAGTVAFWQGLLAELQPDGVDQHIRCLLPGLGAVCEPAHVPPGGHGAHG